MSAVSLACNRFGLGARNNEAAPEDARRWLLGQFDRFEARPQPIAAAPQRAEIAGQLADYFAEVRAEGRAGRRAAPRGRAQPESPPGGDDMAMAPPAMRGQGQGMVGDNDPLAGLPDSARRFLRQTSRRTYLALVQARTNVALTTPAPFVERLVHFWANHFAVSADKLAGHRPRRAASSSRRSARTCSAGSRDMLVAVERHPAMLLYLDQAQSIGPNSHGAAARIAAARRGASAGSTRISRARSSSCTRSACAPATARPTSPNSPAR